MCLFFKKLAISFLLAKFACASLEVKFSDVNSLHSWLKIYSAWSLSFILFSISLVFVL